MEPDDLRALIASCLIRITMNTGETFEVASPELILVADNTATVMVKRNGKLRNVMLALLNIANAESSADSPQ